MVLTSSAKKDRLDIYHGGDKDHPNTFGVLHQNSLNRSDNIIFSIRRRRARVDSLGVSAFFFVSFRCYIVYIYIVLVSPRKKKFSPCGHYKVRPWLLVNPPSAVPALVAL